MTMECVRWSTDSLTTQRVVQRISSRRHAVHKQLFVCERYDGVPVTARKSNNAAEAECHSCFLTISPWNRMRPIVPLSLCLWVVLAGLRLRLMAIRKRTTTKGKKLNAPYFLPPRTQLKCQRDARSAKRQVTMKQVVLMTSRMEMEKAMLAIKLQLLLLGILYLLPLLPLIRISRILRPILQRYIPIFVARIGSALRVICRWAMTIARVLAIVSPIV
jgi:hypothetical protein